MSVLTFTYFSDDGDELEGELPAKNEVCSRCEGYGTHLTPSIGEHAYSREEFEESFDDEESRSAYFQRGGMYDVTCESCHGRRVILVPDEESCRTQEEKTLLELFYQQADEDAAYKRECRAEREYGC